jgi:MoxR-like ATPase
MNANEQKLREKVWEILNTIQANQLYVHSSFIEVPLFFDSTTETEEDASPKEDNKVLHWIKELSLGKKFEDITEDSMEVAPTEDTTKSTGKKSRSKKSSRVKKDTLILPEILTISILNALVPNSAMLLIGGHGGGKSSLVKHLGRMFTGISLLEAEDCIIRGHSQLTEEKMIATLDVAKLLKNGEEEVIWRTFTKSFWKILDEVNRLSPYAQNILLSMLAEGKVKYYDSVYLTDKYILYATLNPGGTGTFDMSPPFLDRFGISVNITMPTTHDLSIILESRDDKLMGYDELMQVPAILNKEQLLSIWYMVDKIKINKSAENFIHSIVREFTLCLRIDKGNSEYLTPENNLCEGCHFNVEKLVCNKVCSILSVRVAKDLLRYSKAMSWLLGLNEVPIYIISTIAPYVISHRAKYVEREMNKAPFFGSKFKYSVYLIELAKNRFINREICYDIIDRCRDGQCKQEDLAVLQSFESSDLITKMDLIPLATALNDEQYKKMVSSIVKYNSSQNLDKLVEINEFLMKSLSFPNRGELIRKIGEMLKTLTFWARNFTFKRWDVVRHTISSLYARFSGPLEESCRKICTLQLREKNLYLEINVTGMEPSSLVQINCYGGKEARELEKVLEKNYPTKNYDFDVEADKVYEFQGPKKKVHEVTDDFDVTQYRITDGAGSKIGSEGSQANSKDKEKDSKDEKKSKPKKSVSDEFDLGIDEEYLDDNPK